ncbi:MAG: hypothetical protein JNL17_12005 [Cyclobacteriaceae bacterium]|nr:hypothetical protein [Cyclobacteriaceae bacterium]
MIKIGDIDLGQVVLELEYQTKLNSMMIETMLNKGTANTLGITQADIETMKERSVKEINDKYGRQMLTYTKPK